MKKGSTTRWAVLHSSVGSQSAVTQTPFQVSKQDLNQLAAKKQNRSVQKGSCFSSRRTASQNQRSSKLLDQLYVHPQTEESRLQASFEKAMVQLIGKS